jgi:hypothetical protein
MKDVLDSPKQDRQRKQFDSKCIDRWSLNLINITRLNRHCSVQIYDTALSSDNAMAIVAE